MAEYSIGDTVLHKMHGRGTVVYAQEDMLAIRHDNGEVKRYLAPYAPIEFLRSGRTELSDRAKVDVLEYIVNQNNAIIERLDRIERMLEDYELLPAKVAKLIQSRAKRIGFSRQRREQHRPGALSGLKRRVACSDAY